MPTKIVQLSPNSVTGHRYNRPAKVFDLNSQRQVYSDLNSTEMAKRINDKLDLIEKHGNRI